MGIDQSNIWLVPFQLSDYFIRVNRNTHDADVLPAACEFTCKQVSAHEVGIGDDNPLWCNPDYAAGTSYGTVVAPPSFVFALNRILSGYVGGLPGIHAMWAGADLTWHPPSLLRVHRSSAGAHTPAAPMTKGVR